MGKISEYVERVRETGREARAAQEAFEAESDRRYEANGRRPLPDDAYPVEHHDAAAAAERTHRDAIWGRR